MPQTPLSAPPVSYSANGTQLLNNAESIRPLHREHSLQPHQQQAYHQHSHSRPAYDPIQEYATDQGRSYASSTGYSHAYQRRHTTASEVSSDTAHHAFASEMHPPSAFQQSVTHHPVVYSSHYHRPQGDSQQQQQQSQIEPGSASRTTSASINIPMSPPLNARTESYYGRTQSSLQALPSLALSQSSSNSRHSATPASSSMLHSASGFQQMPGGPGASSSVSSIDSLGIGGANSAMAGGNRHASPLHISHSATVAPPAHSPPPPPLQSSSSSSSLAVSDGNRMYMSDRQLPSLAELASSAHPPDSFRYSRQQQQPYSSLNQ
ncbi:hypothetical protein LPJ56_003564 [Coemansia sp. RSA 2599]|nr:hypothetical protein LPJ56_003564 [Coemansia sp. RSA 2599]